MTKKQIAALVVGVVLLLACIALAIWLFLIPKPQDTPAASDDKVTYTIQVESEKGTVIPDVGIYVYTDETMTELVWFDRTDAKGKMSFTDVARDTYVAVLSDVPTGYGVEDYYPLTGETTKIVLSAGVLSDEDMQEVTYKLGDLMMDFSITTPDGTVYTLSELLKEKRAVVLNFWYIECGPCGMEFPYMQEAYEEYSDVIEILALNPINQDDAAIAAYQKEKGLTFPMAKVDPAWEKMMQLTAYPTTVVIDRFGNISLLHKGMVDNVETFQQLFAYFSADDYEQRAIQSIEEIVTLEEGTEDNPLQTGSNGAEVSVGAGKEYYLEFYKVSGMYMQVKGESNDFYVMYNDKKYEPSNNTIGMVVKSDGIYYPVKITIGNTGKEKQNFSVTFSALKGTIGNPYSMSLGEFTVTANAGNEQGVYYNYTAEKNGTLTVRCLSSSVSRYGFSLYNMRSYALRNTDEDGVTDEDGYLSVSVQVKKGDPIQFVAAVLPDASNYISGGTFLFEAILTDGTGEEEVKAEPPKTVYTVTVTDEQDTPLSGVAVNLKGSFLYEPTEEDPEDLEAQQIDVDVNLVTDDQGKISSEQVSGPYTATIHIPEGYTVELTQYSLTAETPSVTIKLQKVVMKDYTVTVQYEDGIPAENVIVMIGSKFGYTDAQGKLTLNLPEGTYTVSLSSLPEGYELQPDAVLAFPEGSGELTLTLIKCGTQSNPYEVKEFPFVTRILAAEETIYANFYYESTPVLTVEDPDAVVVYNGTTYTADAETGILEIPMAESTLDAAVPVEIKNAGTGAEGYIVKLVYPLGSKWNPKPVENLSLIIAAVEAGDEDGYYYQYTNGKGGTLELEVFMVSPSSVDYVVTVSSETTGAVTMDGKNSVYVKYGEPAIIHVQAVPVEEPAGGEDPEATVTTFPAVTVYLVGTFTVDPNAVPEDAPIEVPEGKTLYTVILKDYEGNTVSDVMVQFFQNGQQVAADMTGSTGKAYAALVEGSCSVALASTGSKQYYYETLDAVFADGETTLELYVTTVVPGMAEEHWSLGIVKPVKVGGTYCTLQKDVVNYFTFHPTEQGVYRFATSDPSAVISYWGADTYPSEQTDSTDYADNSFTREVNTNGLGQTFVVGVTGAEDCVLIITRIGDATEAVPDEIYEATTPPVAFTFTMPAGKSLTFVELTGDTADYQLVFNETDGYYHLGAADGPVMYIQLSDNVVDPDNPIAPPYVPLYRMVGGMGDNTGTALRGTYIDENGNEIRQDYTECMLAYGACADPTYGIYPLTKDLVYMVQKGGEYQGWWDPENARGNLLFVTEEGDLDTSINLELGWMFALCYVKE